MRNVTGLSAGPSGRQYHSYQSSRSAFQERSIAPLLVHLPRSRKRQLRKLVLNAQFSPDIDQVPQNVKDREAWKEVCSWNVIAHVRIEGRAVDALNLSFTVLMQESRRYRVSSQPLPPHHM